MNETLTGGRLAKRRFSSFFSISFPKRISHLKNRFLWMKFQCWLPDFFCVYVLTGSFAYVLAETCFSVRLRISFRFIFVLDLSQIPRLESEAEKKCFFTSFQSSLTRRFNCSLKKVLCESNFDWDPSKCNDTFSIPNAKYWNTQRISPAQAMKKRHHSSQFWFCIHKSLISNALAGSLARNRRVSPFLNDLQVD